MLTRMCCRHWRSCCAHVHHTAAACKDNGKSSTPYIRAFKHNQRQETRHREDEKLRIQSQSAARPSTSNEAHDDEKFVAQVAVIGLPNSGKSTLINRLVGSEVCATSRLPHTTRAKSLAAFTYGARQVVLADTPGVMRYNDQMKYKAAIAAEQSLVTDTESAMKNATLIMLVLDASMDTPIRRLEIHYRVLHLLYKYRPVPSILVLNKVDRIKNTASLVDMVHRLTGGRVGGETIDCNPGLVGTAATSSSRTNVGFVARRPPVVADVKLSDVANDTPIQCGYDDHGDEIVRDLERSRAVARDRPLHELTDQLLKRLYHGRDGYAHFDRVFYTCARTAGGCKELWEYLLDSAVPRPAFRVLGNAATTKSPVQIVIDAVRAALLNNVEPYVAYRTPLVLTLNEMDPATRIQRYMVDALCESNTESSYLVGHSGSHIKAIAREAEQSISNALGMDVHLVVNVRGAPKFKTTTTVTHVEAKPATNGNVQQPVETTMRDGDETHKQNEAPPKHVDPATQPLQPLDKPKMTTVVKVTRERVAEVRRKQRENLTSKQADDNSRSVKQFVIANDFHDDDTDGRRRRSRK